MPINSIISGLSARCIYRLLMLITSFVFLISTWNIYMAPPRLSMSVKVDEKLSFLKKIHPNFFHGDDSYTWIDTWRAVSKEELWVYSAFQDNRNYTEPHVKIIATGRRVPEIKSASFKCYGLFEGSTELVPLDLSVDYIGHDHHKCPRSALFLKCSLIKVPEGLCPEIVVVTKAKTDVKGIEESSLLRVHRRKNSLQNMSRKMAVCVRPMYSLSNFSFRISEFMAMWTLLGASHFAFYAYEIKTDLRRFLQVLTFYGNISIDLLPWKLPKKNMSWSYAQVEFSQDCVYRHADEYELVVTVDFDEFIIPVKEPDLWSFLDREDMKDTELTKFSSYSFQNCYFCGPSPNNSFFVTQSWTERDNKFFKLNDRSKVIVRPLRIESMLIHLEQKHLPTFKAKAVPHSLAYLHHYRRGKGRCKGSIKDTTALKFGDQLINSHIINVWREFNDSMFMKTPKTRSKAKKEAQILVV